MAAGAIEANAAHLVEEVGFAGRQRDDDAVHRCAFLGQHRFLAAVPQVVVAEEGEAMVAQHADRLHLAAGATGGKALGGGDRRRRGIAERGGRWP